MLQFFLLVVAHPFLAAIALCLFGIIATMIADYFHNGAGLDELRDLWRQRKGELLLSLLIIYALSYLIVNAILLAAHFILDHA